MILAQIDTDQCFLLEELILAFWCVWPHDHAGFVGHQRGHLKPCENPGSLREAGNKNIIAVLPSKLEAESQDRALPPVALGLQAAAPDLLTTFSCLQPLR